MAIPPLDLVSLPLRKNLHATDENSRAGSIGNVFTFGQFQQQLGYGIFGRTHVQNSPRRVDALARKLLPLFQQRSTPHLL